MAFVDVLGLSASLRALETVASGSAPQLDEMTKRVYEVGRPLMVFREDFRKYFVSATSYDRARVHGRKVPPEARRLLRKSLVGQTFSDCMVFSVPADSTVDYSPLTSVYALLQACAAMVVMTLASAAFLNKGAGKAIRGAIEFGYGMEMFRHEVMSSSLVKAYELESKTAVNPRIVVGPDLLKWLNDQTPVRGASLHDSRLEQDYRRRIVQETLDLIVTDELGVAFLDFLSPVLRRSFDSDQTFSSVLVHACAFVIGERDRLAALGVPFASKYEYLVDHFATRAPEVYSQALSGDLPDLT